MDYYRAEFIISCAIEILPIARELLAHIAGQYGFEAFEDSKRGIVGYVQTCFFCKDELDKALAYFPISNVSITYTFTPVIAQDWNEIWERQGFEPIDIDNKLLVYDARKPIPTIKRPFVIGIETQMSFGTGIHETTQMILSYLLTISMRGKRILDCGCGTGILGITARKLGATEVIAYDIDSWSVRNTSHNAEINRVTNINVLKGDVRVLALVNGMFDIVLANINLNTLLSDLPYYKRVLRPNGIIIISGFYIEDIPLLKANIITTGLTDVANREKNGWAMLALH